MQTELNAYLLVTKTTSGEALESEYRPWIFCVSSLTESELNSSKVLPLVKLGKGCLLKPTQEQLNERAALLAGKQFQMGMVSTSIT